MALRFVSFKTDESIADNLDRVSVHQLLLKQTASSTTPFQQRRVDLDLG